MFIVDPAKLKKQTIAILAMLAAGTLGLQIEWVQQHVTPLVASHPHWSFLSAGLIGALTLIHNPVAQKVAKSVLIDSQEDADGSKQETKIETTTTSAPPTP